MIGSSVSKLVLVALIGFAGLLCLSLSAVTEVDKETTQSADNALLEALAAPACEAPAASKATEAGWEDLASLSSSGQCTNDKQCVKVCPCLPQCVNGYCANCVWCPPSS